MTCNTLYSDGTGISGHSPTPRRESIESLAKHIRLLVLDVDGVMTDGSYFYAGSGKSVQPGSTFFTAVKKRLQELVKLFSKYQVRRRNPMKKNSSWDFFRTSVHSKFLHGSQTYCKKATNYAILVTNTRIEGYL